MPSLPESPRLRRILLAYTVNQLGTWLAYVALLLSVYDHTRSALAVAGLLVAGRLLPALFTPTLVATLEVSHRRGSLSGLYLLEAAAAAALAVLLSHFWLPGVLALVAIDGTAALTASALLRATAARVAAEDEIALGTEETAQRVANASLNLGFTVAVTIGPAMGGAIVAAAGSPTALLIDAATFLACGALLMNLRLAGVHDQDGPSAAPSVSGRLTGAWRHLREVPQLRGLLIVEALAIVCFASVEPVEVLYAKATLNAGDRGFGLLTAAWGVGMVCGGLLFARAVRRPLRPMLLWGTVAVGLAYIGFALAPTLALACVAAVLGGLGNGVQWAALISAVQQLTPHRLLGRLMSTVEVIGAVCPALGFVVGGALAQLGGPRTAMLIAGIAATLATGLFVRVTRGEIAHGATVGAATTDAADPLAGMAGAQPGVTAASGMQAQTASEQR